MTKSVVLYGKAFETLRKLADNSVDAVVCDPPYGLSKAPDPVEMLRHWLAGDDYIHQGGGFMGKSWDSFVPGPSIWRECLRVLKPGGHMLVFGGTRTYDLLVLSIRLANFEIRDTIAWMYGSGFPKSLDVSKAIDKAGGDPLAWRAFSRAYALAIEGSALTHSDVDRHLGIKSSSCYWAREDHRGGMPPRHHWEKVQTLVSLTDGFEALYAEAEREIIGRRERGFAPGTNAVYGAFSGDERVTAAASDAAQQWEGWGTALKPAHEPIVVARKPLAEKTVAKNVLENGTGALNIDATRVAFQGDEDKASAKPGGKATARSGALAGKTQAGHFVIVGPTDLEDGPLYWSNQDGWGGRSTATVFDESEAGLSDPDETVRREWMDDNDGRKEFHAVQGKGRWPANVILDEDAGRSLDEMTGELKSGAPPTRRSSDKFRLAYGDFEGQRECEPGRGANSGGASRFFYCSKSSTRERNEGLPEGMKNTHATVKPLSLMRYLVRLVTPPEGRVLDPYCGSGTTGCAAALEGMSFIGIDNEEESVEIARARIAHWRAGR